MRWFDLPIFMSAIFQIYYLILILRACSRASRFDRSIFWLFKISAFAQFLEEALFQGKHFHSFWVFCCVVVILISNLICERDDSDVSLWNSANLLVQPLNSFLHSWLFSGLLNRRLFSKHLSFFPPSPCALSLRARQSESSSSSTHCLSALSLKTHSKRAHLPRRNFIDGTLQCFWRASCVEVKIIDSIT